LQAWEWIDQTAGGAERERVHELVGRWAAAAEHAEKEREGVRRACAGKLEAKTYAESMAV
jgi:hypothetical protein